MTPERALEALYDAGWRLIWGVHEVGKWYCRWVLEDRDVYGSGVTVDDALMSAYRAALHGIGGKRRAA